VQNAHFPPRRIEPPLIREIKRSDESEESEIIDKEEYEVEWYQSGDSNDMD
jgi:hypothetical protein